MAQPAPAEATCDDAASVHAIAEAVPAALEARFEEAVPFAHAEARVSEALIRNSVGPMDRNPQLKGQLYWDVTGSAHKGAS